MHYSEGSMIPEIRTIPISQAEAEYIIKDFASNPLPKISMKDGTVLVSKEKGKIIKISIDQFVKTIEHYHLENLLTADLYKYLKSVKSVNKTSLASEDKKNEKKTHSWNWTQIISAGFDEYSGVSKTQAYTGGDSVSHDNPLEPPYSLHDSSETREEDPEDFGEKEVEPWGVVRNPKESNKEEDSEDFREKEVGPWGVVRNPKASTKEEDSEDFGEKEVASSEIVGNPKDSSIKKSEKSSIALENQKRFQEEMDILLLIKSCVMDAKLGNHESTNIAMLAEILQIDQKQSANVIKIYQKFKKLWNNIDSLREFQNKNSLSSDEVRDFFKKLGYPRVSENQANQFINKPDKLLLAIQVLLITSGKEDTYSLSEEELKTILQVLLAISREVSFSTEAILTQFV